jgi:ribosomal protein S21
MDVSAEEIQRVIIKKGLMMNRKGCKRCVSVEVKSPDQLEHALRSLKRKLKKENFYVELRRREFYQKPSEIKRAKKRRRKTIDGDELNSL